jgi:hypothetical protein
VLAPNSKHRINVTPAKRGKGSDKLHLKSKKNAEPTVGEDKETSWAQPLKRVFNIDVTTCSCCGGAVKMIASIILWDVIAPESDYLGVIVVPDPWDAAPIATASPSGMTS